ncbi:helix-turn-helix domain-containing protein [Celeribacter sp.]|uniref:helix-turn-helix domain-containing protein n=1 Tax=Celeribacter sp. TaxID=1890673 RepID=UPI003A907C56
MKSQNLPRNLRLLLGKYNSLAEGAHHIGINRQQLNKYLNGSSFPSAHTLGRIAKTLNVELDMLFADPDKFDRASSERLDLSTPVEASMNATYKRAMERTVRENQALAAYCGDYLFYHRTAMSDHKVHTSLIRIYQEKQKTFAKSLMALRRDGQPRTGIRTYKHGSLVFLNSGCLNILRMSNLNDGDTDLGLLIMKLPRLKSEKFLFGHTLTTSLNGSGIIVPSKVVFQKVTGNILELYREHCGAWPLESPHLPPCVQEHFGTQTYAA